MTQVKKPKWLKARADNGIKITRLFCYFLSFCAARVYRFPEQTAELVRCTVYSEALYRRYASQ